MRRAAKVCCVPGCPEFVTARSYCDKHAREGRQRTSKRPSSAARGYDAQWRKIRAEHLAEHPYCISCGAPATEVDHILPISEGGTHDYANLQAMCKSCHSRKTAKRDGGFGRERR